MENVKDNCENMNMKINRLIIITNLTLHHNQFMKKSLILTL